VKNVSYAAVLLLSSVYLSGCSSGNEELLIQQIAELNSQITTMSQILTGLGIAVIIIGGSFAISTYKLLRKERG